MLMLEENISLMQIIVQNRRYEVIGTHLMLA